MRRRKRGIALAGGGPLGAIWEIGALVALDEALAGLDFTGCDVFVGVSSGAFIAAGLANGIGPRTMHRMFIESATADEALDPDLLLRPALGEYARCVASLPELLTKAAGRTVGGPLSGGGFDSLQELARALPRSVFDNAGVGDYLADLFSAPGRTNDFRRLAGILFLVATDLDTAEAVEFGSPGWDDVPISRAVQASAALPGLFPPVEIRGRHFVDGALTKTLHASAALRKGADLVLCINPLLPFDADLAAHRMHRKRISLAERGLPSILSQSLRSLINSRMLVGMGRYEKEFPDADILLFEPSRGDTEMFFTNIFSYGGRHRLSEHAYRMTRAELRRRAEELNPILARHGIQLDQSILADRTRRLDRSRGRSGRRHAKSPGQVALELGQVLDDLDAFLKSRNTTPAA